MPQSRRLLMLVPGLLGPVTEPAAVEGLHPSIRPLERMLARADVLDEVNPDFESAVFAAFGLGGRDLPVAAVSRLGELDGGTAHVGESCWLRADPVHLRVDTHSARLFGSHVLDLEPDEALGLTTRLNDHFGQDGLRFEAPVPDRWYVAVRGNVDLHTHSPQQVAGRNIDAFLPEGEDASRWRQWMNEAQMLLHDAPENIARETEGRLAVNSFWPWGAGRLPNDPFETVPAAAWADDPLVQGLARMADVPAQPLPNAPGEWTPVEGRNLIVDPRPAQPLVHGDIEGWLSAVTRHAQDWLVPLYERLVAQEIDELELAVDGNRRFLLLPTYRRRWWRRSRPWTQWLDAE